MERSPTHLYCLTCAPITEQPAHTPFPPRHIIKIIITIMTAIMKKGDIILTCNINLFRYLTFPHSPIVVFPSLLSLFLSSFYLSYLLSVPSLFYSSPSLPFFSFLYFFYLSYLLSIYIFSSPPFPYPFPLSALFFPIIFPILMVFPYLNFLPSIFRSLSSSS